MRTIGNVLWLVLAGWLLALGYVVAGLIAFVLLITIPFGIASFRLAAYVIWPFGRRTEFRRDAGALAMIGNVVWIVVFVILKQLIDVKRGKLEHRHAQFQHDRNAKTRSTRKLATV